MHRLKTLVLVALAVVAFAACGGDDSSPLSSAEQDVADELGSQLANDYADADGALLISDEESQCYGEKLVRSLGIDEADEFLNDGFSSGTVDRETAETAAAAVTSCVNVKELYKGGLADILEGDQLDCAVAELVKLGDLPFIQEFTGEDDDSFDDITEKCDLPF